MTFQELSPVIVAVVFTAWLSLWGIHIRNGVRKARAADRKPAE